MYFILELIGVDERGDYCSSLTEDKKLQSILTLAEFAGMSTGFVTTARVTHHSPAPLYAHSVSGDCESDKDKLEQAKDDATKCPDIGEENTNAYILGPVKRAKPKQTQNTLNTQLKTAL